MTDITMPRLSDSMEEGTILTWLKGDGEDVEAGEDLVEIETDKATVTHAADASGVLTIVADEGAVLRVGATIARVGEGVTAPGASPAAEESTPAASSGVEMGEQAATPVSEDGQRSNGLASIDRVRATPLARRVAEHHGVALEDISGTGPLGRVTRADVLRAAGIEPEAPTTALPPTAPAEPVPQVEDHRPKVDDHRPGVTRREPTRLQKVIARRMAEAKATIPHFQVQTEVQMDAAIELRAKLKASAREGETVPSLNDFMIKASALALREHPLANGSFKDGGFELHEAINIGVAVAADDALVVPTVVDAAAKSLGEIARESRRLANRVRSGEITPPELSGGTFTVSNLGMFGMTAITPVVNPPQAAILGVGAMRAVLTKRETEITERQLMTLTLSCDHRILYGADAARFLARIRDLLQEPLRLAL